MVRRWAAATLPAAGMMEMAMDLNGKRALVTGGAVRLGRAVCEALAGAGCDVVIHCLRSRREAARLARALSDRFGVRAAVVTGDLSRESGCMAVLASAWRAAGGLDVLVNNASVYSRAPLAKTGWQEMSSQMAVNLFAAVSLTRGFARRAAAGCVINILDRRIVGNEPGCAAYLLGKKALGEFTRCAALELAPRFTVNAVAPGPVLPPHRVRGSGRAAPEPAGMIPLGRRPSPADVAAAAVFLLESDAVTGQTVFVDGGQHLLGTMVPAAGPGRRRGARKE